MPHVAGHKEDEPILDFTGAFEEEPQLDFTDAFGVGQGRTEQRYVPENNSIVTMPATSSPSFDSREAKELIDGQEGFFGNTPIFDLGAPGGFAELEDIKKIIGVLTEMGVTTITGGLRERIVLGAEKRDLTQEDIVEIQSLAIEGAVDISRGEFRSGVTKLFDMIGKARQIAPRGHGTKSLFDDVADLIIQSNPEQAQQFNDKMLELQAANEDFLIRNGLMFGPDDEPTFVGNIISQAGPTFGAIGLAVVLKSPALPAVLFGVSQQVSGFQEAEKAGKDPFAAQTIGDVQGIIEAGIEFLEIGQLTKIIRLKSVSIVSKIIAGMIAEGVQEGATEALIASVQNLTGVKDMTLREALNTVFQAVFYGALSGGGVTGSIATVQRMTGGSVSEQDVKKIASIMEGQVADAALDTLEQAIDDAETELEIGRDNASGQPVTKAAKATGEQQKRVVEIIQKVNEGKDINIKETLDEIFPEQRVQREKQKLEQDRSQRARKFTKQGIKEAVGQIQAEIQIAEQQGDAETEGRLSEDLDRIQQLSFTDETVRAAVEELQAEGLLPFGSKVFEDAIEDIDDLLRPIRAGVRVGRISQDEESAALQKPLSKIIDRLVREDVIDAEPARRLEKKVKKATTVKNAESIRRDIISQARKAAFRKFKRERVDAIRETIKNLAEKKVGELDPDSQNSIDAMNKMRIGRESARKAKGLPPRKKRTPEQRKQATESIEQQTIDFNIKQSRRIEKDMEQGIPAEGVMLQVRYLDILNEKAKATPEQIASFEDDLNAFIETGKGIATVANAVKQKIVDDTKLQIRTNKTTDSRASIEAIFPTSWDKEFGWWAVTLETQVRSLQLKGTPFDLFDAEIADRLGRQESERERNALIDEVSEDDGGGVKYRAELKDSKVMVIDVPLEGHAKRFGGTKPKRIRMTRGQLIQAWMYLREGSVAKQMTDPNMKMGWTDKLVQIINARMTIQDVAFAEGMFEIYNRSYDRFNATYRRTHNRDLTRVEFYSHLSRDGQEGIDASTHNETMFIDLIAPKDRGGVDLFENVPKESIERVENASSEIKIGNVIDMHDNYIWDVEHFISHAEPLQLITTLLKDEEFVKDLEDILTPGGFQNFKAHLKVTARANVGSGKTFPLIEKFRRKAFTAVLLSNEKIGLGQTATVMAWAPRMPKSDLGFGVQDYAFNPAKANAILDKHATFKNRELNFDNDIEQLGTTGELFKFLSWSIRKGDGFGVRAGAWADILSSMKRKGLSEEEALNDAAEFAEISQQSTLPSQKTLAQKSDNPFVRTMTMYRSSLIAMFNVSMQSINEYRQADTSTPKKKSAARKKLYETLVAQNIVIPGLYALLTGRPLTTTVLIGSSQALPLVSDLLEIIIGVVMNIFREEDEKIYYNGPLSEIPAGKAFMEVGIAIDNMGEFVDDTVRNGLSDALDDVTIWTFFESLQGIMETTTGFPMTNVMNKADGAMKLFDTDDPIDAMLQIGGYREESRKRTIKRLDLLTGGESTQDSGKILTPGAF